ncbi:response regulator receiver domain-containing protein [Hoeflea marina]|uniref:Response regulator receiver domain-containing protein n=2 Tax=Hoeflea marina TaxID=274592 RepID=A0A317PI69_9HYPH|nr:response regulator receiver domain-containing protein [Hoeflea marina]
MTKIVQRPFDGHEKTACRVLIVEDQLLIALDLESLVDGSSAGVRVVGMASDLDYAMSFMGKTDIAFVDINLADGPTGPEIGRRLADAGVTVIFMTGNPEQLGDGVAGTLGVLTKPVSAESVQQALDFAVAKRERRLAVVPRLMRSFA